MRNPKTFSIFTFGCRTNQAESRKIGEELVTWGLVLQERGRKVERGKKVDLVVLNTCAVTAKAEKEVRQAIRRIKRERPDCFLVVMGCWVNKIKNEKLKIRNYNSKFKIFKKIDLLVRNKDKEMIGEILKKHFRKSCPKDTSEVAPQKAGTPRRWRGKRDFQDKYAKSQKALVKIQDGCDNFCTYCLVPYLRGRSRSRPAEEIIKEINQLVERGIKEVVLTGIDIADYKFVGADFMSARVGAGFSIPITIKNDLGKLLILILAKTKIEKISFGSMNFEAFTDEFIKLYQNYKVESLWSPHSSEVKLGLSAAIWISPSESNSRRNAFVSMKDFGARIVKAHQIGQTPRANMQFLRLTTHFHIPLQSGCDATLKRMGRKYSIKNYELRIMNLKKSIPGFSFSTDVMVGFPGETAEEFEESLRGIREIREILGRQFTKIHLFRYSSRPGTVAYKMEGRKGWERVKEKIKRERTKQVLKIFKGNS